MAQCKLGDETRGLFERFLAISIRDSGPDGRNTAIGNYNLYKFYRRLADEQLTVDSWRTHILLAKSYIVTALQIYTKIYGPTHPDTLNAASILAAVSSVLLEMLLA
jgi:hypothetical protein